ncbi:hypothetical protein [Klebsiella pneumoniae]|uniref:hypothetical protein n=1 Tax=Klebsiella pneumoniae TaxID=573 RepID=UPI0034D3136A
MKTRNTFTIKSIIPALAIMLSASASAHMFGPASMQNSRGVDGKTTIIMQITSKWSGLYSFSVGGKTLTDSSGKPVQKFVMAGMRADFPMTINNRYIANDRILICSWENREQVTFRQEVCFNVKV